MNKDDVVTLRVKPDMKAALKSVALKDKRTMSQWLEILIQEKLEVMGEYPPQKST